MLYFKDAKFRAESYESDFLDFRVLKEVYSKEENLKFLIFSFDYIKEVKEYNQAILWEGESLHSILKSILSNKRDTNELFIYFSTLLFSFDKKLKVNLLDFIRVVRNLIENTPDNSRREWPRLISSLKNLIADENVYSVLSELKDENKLQGFNVDQRKEEVFKAKLIQEFSVFKSLLFEIEDSKNFKGNIANILKIPFVDSEEKFKDYELESIVYEEKQLKALGLTFEGYKEISKQDFNPIWGNLLNTTLYTQTYESRLVYSGLFKKHPAILLFAKRFAKSKLSLLDYIKKIQKEFILSLAKKFNDFSEIKQVKDQLFLYYIISERIYNQTYIQFFKNYNFNFGWLAKETGYKSLFTNGIEGCQYFQSTNPIFQTYNQQFRYNLGLNENNTLDIEIIGGNKKRNPFELILNWAKGE